MEREIYGPGGGFLGDIIHVISHGEDVGGYATYATRTVIPRGSADLSKSRIFLVEVSTIESHLLVVFSKTKLDERKPTA